MRRAGGWILGFCVVAAMAAGGWMAFRKVLVRETLTIEVTRGNRDPSSDAMWSGIRFALDEVGNRAGGYRIKLVELPGPNPVRSGIWISMDDHILIEADVLIHYVGSISLGSYSVEGPGGIRILSSLTMQGEAAAAWAVDTGSRRIVVLCDETSARSTEIAGGFGSKARALGIPIIARLKTEMDRATLLDQILGIRPDFVFYAGEEAPYSRAFEIFDEIRKKDYKGRLMTGEADPEVSYLAVPTKIVDGTFLISPIGLPSPEFSAAYEPATGRHAGPHAWPGYLTMKALLQVVDRAGSKETEDLHRAQTEFAPKPLPCALYVARNGKFEFVQDLK